MQRPPALDTLQAVRDITKTSMNEDTVGHGHPNAIWNIDTLIKKAKSFSQRAPPFASPKGLQKYQTTGPSGLPLHNLRGL